jgi:ankyrin repeat protein
MTDNEVLEEIQPSEVTPTSSLGHCRSPFQAALCYGSFKSLKLLLAKLPAEKVNTPGAEGVTPLHLAVQRNDRYVLKLLLDSIPRDRLAEELSLQTRDGITPLQRAVERKHGRMITTLLEVPPEHLIQQWFKQTSQGQTVLHFAVNQGEKLARNSSTDILEVLLEKAPSDLLSIGDQAGNTALHLAVERENRNFVVVLLERMSSGQISLKNSAGDTALDLAKRTQNEGFARLIKNALKKSE